MSCMMLQEMIQNHSRMRHLAMSMVYQVLLSSSGPASIGLLLFALTLPCLDMCLLLKWNMSFDFSNAFDKS